MFATLKLVFVYLTLGPIAGIVGIPYTESALSTTQTGGTPYGASHFARAGTAEHGISADEKTLAIALGARIARTAAALSERP